jgi:hypothetical protein
VALRRVRAPHIDFGALRRELKLPEGYPAEAAEEAERSAADPPAPPVDRTDLPFATIDPATSLDLDQAMCLQRRATGHRVSARSRPWPRSSGPTGRSRPRPGTGARPVEAYNAQISLPTAGVTDQPTSHDPASQAAGRPRPVRRRHQAPATSSEE